MNKTERVQAALSCEPVDRIPINIWLHYPHLDQDPGMLAEWQVHEACKFDYDFIKLVPFGLYSVQDWGCQVKFYCTKHDSPIVGKYAIQKPADWEGINELPGDYGVWGKQLQLARRVEKLTGGSLPFIQTLFSPMTTAKKMAGDQLEVAMREHPEKLHHVLKVITKTTINFVKANIEAGVSGFFLATQNAVKDDISEKDFNTFCKPYDLEVIESYNSETWFNPLHIHGNNTYMEKLLSEYPVNCFSWHDRWSSCSFEMARKYSDKCFIGGLNEVEVLYKGTVEEVQDHVMEIRRSMNDKGFMLAPGCVANPKTPDINYFAARLALERSI